MILRHLHKLGNSIKLSETRKEKEEKHTTHQEMVWEDLDAYQAFLQVPPHQGLS